ncbi:hypothetical protein ACFX2I_031039 [Malus domestica]
MIDFHGIDEGLVEKMVYDHLVWSSLHGLVVGDKSVQRSGKVPGVGMVHAPFALFPMPFPESHWKQMISTANSEVIITNDGATILNRMEVLQPATKMLVKLSKSQDAAVSDIVVSWHLFMAMLPFF